MHILELNNVTTAVHQKVLLKDISFTIEKGKVMALVGHNGAGKSTLMKTIMHIHGKKSGTITLLDTLDQERDLLAFKKQIAYLPEEPMLLPEMTVMQHFQLYGISYQVPEDIFLKRTQTLVQAFELDAKLDVYPEELSKGMRQKVQTICAMLPDVALLLIDEPFMGLDIYAVEYLLELMKEKVWAGTSILLTTHQLEQVRNLANDFILLKQGEIHESGPISQFASITRGQDDV